MKLFFVILLGFLALFSGAAYMLFERAGSDADKWIEIYFSQARVPMFTGFLTLGSFLLTLQTAIIQRLKEAYDSPDYSRRVAQMREKGKEVKHYGSLERVGIALSSNVILALSTSLLQMTLGFVRETWSTAVCISFGLTTILLVVYLTIQLVLAHRQWFKKIEEEKSKHPVK